MKAKGTLSAIGAAAACCFSISAALAAEDNGPTASEQIMASSAWQQIVSQAGDPGVLFSGLSGGAQVDSEEAEYGPGTNYTTLPAASFQPAVDVTGTGDRYLLLPLLWPGNPAPPTPDAFDLGVGNLLSCLNPAAAPIFVAPLHLPSGVKITGMELYGVDVDNTAQVRAGLVNVCNTTPGTLGPPPDPKWGTLSRLSITPGSGNAATPGIVRLTGSTVSHTMDNQNCAYTVTALANCGGFTTGIFKARVAWQRQISPAPGTATFSDVSTSHAFFKEVEAMVSAGITGGCGGGRYCPDNTLTRGQMAAFLARAMGL